VNQERFEKILNGFCYGAIAVALVLLLVSLLP